MEWMHLESSINKKVDACHAAPITNETIDINKNGSEKKKKYNNKSFEARKCSFA